MKRILVAGLAAGMLTASAAAFDNSTCPKFLVGDWKIDLYAAHAGVYRSLLSRLCATFRFSTLSQAYRAYLSTAA